MDILHLTVLEKWWTRVRPLWVSTVNRNPIAYWPLLERCAKLSASRSPLSLLHSAQQTQFPASRSYPSFPMKWNPSSSRATRSSALQKKHMRKVFNFWEAAVDAMPLTSMLSRADWLLQLKLRSVMLVNYSGLSMQGSRKYKYVQRRKSKSWHHWLTVRSRHPCRFFKNGVRRHRSFRRGFANSWKCGGAREAIRDSARVY